MQSIYVILNFLITIAKRVETGEINLNNIIQLTISKILLFQNTNQLFLLSFLHFQSSKPQFGLATLQVLGSYVFLVAAILGSIGLDPFEISAGQGGTLANVYD